MAKVESSVLETAARSTDSRVRSTHALCAVCLVTLVLKDGSRGKGLPRFFSSSDNASWSRSRSILIRT